MPLTRLREKTPLDEAAENLAAEPQVAPPATSSLYSSSCHSPNSPLKNQNSPTSAVVVEDYN